jgi:predicted metalloprotease
MQGIYFLSDHFYEVRHLGLVIQPTITSAEKCFLQLEECFSNGSRIGSLRCHSRLSVSHVRIAIARLAVFLPL